MKRESPNRRTHARFEIRLAAEIVTGKGRSFAAATRDLSRGGCCLESAYPLPDGEVVRLHLFVVVDGVEEASLPPMKVSATVKWTAENDEAPLDSRHVAGVEFAHLSVAEADWLARFLG